MDLIKFVPSAACTIGGLACGYMLMNHTGSPVMGEVVWLFAGVTFLLLGAIATPRN